MFLLLRLNAPDHFTASRAGVQQLPQEAFKGQSEGEDPRTTVIFGFLRIECVRRNQCGKAFVEFLQRIASQLLNSLFAHRAQATSPLTEIRCMVHRAVYIPPY